MKKLLSCVLAFVALLSLASLAGCAQNETGAYTKVALTKENYSEYIAVNVYYTDFQAHTHASASGAALYDVAAIGHIETSRRKDVSFEDVSITFSAGFLGDYFDAGGCIVQLDLDGNAHGSFSTHWENTAIFAPPHQPILSVNGISGYAFVPSEA